MGLSIKKLKRQISIKNVSPVAKLVSVVKPTAEKVIDTRTIGIKDVLAVSPIGISQTLTNTGTSNIVDVVMDKPIVPVAEVDTFVDTTSTTTPAVTTPVVTTPAVTTPVVKKKPNTLMYAGIGVGVLVLGYFGYKFIKK
jgi:hypothetical protein